MTGAPLPVDLRWDRDNQPVVHRSGWVAATAETVLRDGWVVVRQGRVVDLGSGRPPGGLAVVDHGGGVLLPAPVNAHTHLELSALAGRLPTGAGFRTWVEALITARGDLTEADLERGLHRAVAGLAASGCAVVGEISSQGRSWTPLRKAGLAGIWFRESLGHEGAETLPADAADGGLRASLAGHAPHTTAPELLVRLKRTTAALQRPFAIHLAESVEETDFLTTGKGSWARLLARRRIDVARWPLPAPSPVAYARRLGLLDAGTLAVHLLQVDRGEFARLAAEGVKVCVCPRSNEALHGRLPDIEAMLAAGLAPCLGTDSLASAPSLSIWDEMAFVARRYPGLDPRRIWAMASGNGARCLGMDAHYGRLVPGSAAAMVYGELTAASQRPLFEAVVQWAADARQEPTTARKEGT